MSPLPNPGMSFTPFDQLPAASLNDIVENVESLADGSGIATSAITPEKLSTGAGTTWAWQTWTPTWTNAPGTTAYAKYIKIGKTVYFKARLNVTGAFTGVVTVSLPVTAAALTDTDDIILSTCRYKDTGTAFFPGNLRYASTTTVTPVSGANMNDVNATTPHTWANTDIMIVTGSYEAA